MAVTVAERPTLAQRVRRWEGLPYWLVLPTLAFLALFFAWPMVQSFELAFRDEGRWTLDHVRTMRNDLRFEEAFWFTLLLIAVIIPVQFLLALGMALLVNAKLRRAGSSSTSSCSRSRSPTSRPGSSGRRSSPRRAT